MRINTDIFKAYDVRGLYPGEINEEVARQIGRGFVTYLGATKIGVSRDMRVSSPGIAAAFIQGAREQGADVVDYGMLGTDMLYFAVVNDGLEGGAQVTASHNPKQYNGVKMVRAGALPLSGDQGLGEIRDMIVNDRLPQAAATPGSVSPRNIIFEYVEKVMSFIDPAVIKPFTVVLEARSGNAGLVAPLLLDQHPFNTTNQWVDIDRPFHKN
jgi:phosphomannomutase